MRHLSPLQPAALVLCALAVVACTSQRDRDAKERLLTRSEAPPERSTPASPEASLALDADAVAARLGSFDWSATAQWSVYRASNPAKRIQAAERHRVRQLASGELEVEGDVDPGLGPGSETGKRVVYANKMTYARSRYAPYGAARERPTDRGRDARRFRDESFELAADLVRLFGPGLSLEPAGETSYLSRRVRRFVFRLTPGKEQPAPARAPGTRNDPDTEKRLAFLEGRIPAKVEGELLADAETGAPLEVKLEGTLRDRSDPDFRADVSLTAGVRALGGAVGAVMPPAGALPDERKPKGVARALEQAGLKKGHEAEDMGRDDREPEAADDAEQGE